MAIHPVNHNTILRQRLGVGSTHSPIWIPTSRAVCTVHTDSFHQSMSPDSSDHPRQVAIEQLQAFGLSAYAAETFVTLVRIETGTAKEISDVSEVPRTRVYDAVDDLERRGLVDVQHSNPKQFRAVSLETAGQHFEQYFTRRLNRFRDATGELETTTQTEEQRGVWTVTGCDTITERILEFIDAANETVVFMSVENLLTEEIVASLSAAQDRGVSIRLGGMSETSRQEIETVVPETEFVPSLWNWAETPSGRLVMVDDETTLVSVLVPDDGRTVSKQSNETAIWGAGVNNSLVVVLRALFTWQLDSSSFE